MNKKLRVLFMGTPEFAVHILDSIVKEGYDVVGVVSVPDKPAGRGRKLQESAVTQYAKENGLNLMQPEKLKAKSFLTTLEALQPDVCVVVAFRMLPEVVWKIPPRGTFNLHASLLPQYRGAAPINWAIINGESETGVTTFMIDKNIDTGNILLKKKVAIFPDENAGELHDRLMIAGGELVNETLKGIEENRLEPQEQQVTSTLKDAPKIFKEDCLINWDRPMNEIYDFIRGLSPYPAAWTYFFNQDEVKTLKIFRVSVQYQPHQMNPKRVITQQQRIGVTHKDGFIWLDEVQLEGKRRMEARDFMNGLTLSDDAHVLEKHP